MADLMCNKLHKCSAAKTSILINNNNIVVQLSETETNR